MPSKYGDTFVIPGELGKEVAKRKRQTDYLRSAAEEALRKARWEASLLWAALMEMYPEIPWNERAFVLTEDDGRAVIKDTGPVSLGDGRVFPKEDPAKVKEIVDSFKEALNKEEKE